MKREIKFRVWNKNRNMFIIDGMTPKEIQDDATQSMELPIMTNEDCIWQQYTGLKDKNGVEVYEGDIVQYYPYHNLGHNSETETGTVEWGETGDSDGYSHCKHYEWIVGYDSLADVADSEFDGFECVVVGNIFEGVDK